MITNITKDILLKGIEVAAVAAEVILAVTIIKIIQTNEAEVEQ